MTRAAILLSVLLFLPCPLAAVEPGEILKDPVLEERARTISKELRCLVCQNQSIDDSDADLARDLRVLVRERLTAGDSDDQVISYIVSRYGDFVLLRPPVNKSTAILWGGPALILLAGALGLVLYFRRRRGIETAKPLSREEEARLAEIRKGDAP